MGNKVIRYLIFFTVLLLLTLSLVVACFQPQISPPPTPPEPPPTQPPTASENQTTEEAPPVNETIEEEQWYTLGTFSGTGNDTIPSFRVYGTEWLITWTIDTEYPENAALDIIIYFSPSGLIWKTASLTGGVSGNITYAIESESNRDFSINIIARNLLYWTITLEDNAPPIISSPIKITYIRYKGTFYLPDPDNYLCYERVEPDEYVVIKNLGESPVKMGGWVLKNISKPSPSFTFPSHFIAEPGQIIRVYTDEVYPECDTWRAFGTGAKAADCTDPKQAWFSFYYGTGDIWSNDNSDIAVLYDEQGNEISRKSYAVQTENE